MMDVLSPRGLAALAAASRRGLVVALDFDGTLAPIVDVPQDARMREETRELLRLLALRTPCVVISGRGRADLLPRLDGVPLEAVVGNNGAEPDEAGPSPALRARVAAWVEVLRAAVDPAEVQLEDKGFSLAAHYRRARAPEEAARRLREAAGALADARLLGGHAVLNVFPREAPTKGDAVVAFAARHPGRPLAFVGDDEIDEAAFRSPVVSLPVRVGRHPPSAAGYFLEAQDRMDALLRELVAAREQADRLRTTAEHQGGRTG
jgi:trehalose 6-phosphate phosphatase